MGRRQRFLQKGFLRGQESRSPDGPAGMTEERIHKTMLQTGEMINGTYQVMQEIGRGGTGQVWLAYHHHLRKYVVLKRIAVSSVNTDALRIETDILKNLHHPYLPQVYDFVERSGEVFTVMDYIEGYDLSRYGFGSRVFPETLVRRLLTEMGEVLSYLHHNHPRIIHSDIKPENIILKNDGHLCLIDFNISLDAEDEYVRGFSRYFASPEQISQAENASRGIRTADRLDARTDVYSTGATFYYLLTGIRPNGVDRVQPLIALRPPGYSEGLLRVIDRAMAWNRASRYTDGRRLLAAVNRLKMEDSEWRSYVLLRSASWILSAVFVAGGAFCLLHGLRMQIREGYLEQLRGIRSAVERGADEDAEDRMDAFLNNRDYDAIRKANPQDSYYIYDAIGSICFRRGDYGEAEDAYREALGVLQEADAGAFPQKNEDLTNTYLNLIVSAAKNGDVTEATGLLTEAERGGAGSSSLLLAKAELSYAEQDYDGCIDTLAEYLEEPVSDTQRADAYLLGFHAAEAKGDKRAAASFLKQMEKGTAGAYYRRQAAASLYGFSDDPSFDEAERAAFKEQAVSIYRELYTRSGSEIIDAVNYAMVLEMDRDGKGCYDIVNPLIMQGETDYRLYMLRAFAYEDMKDTTRAKEDAEKALALYEEQSSAYGEEDRDAFSRLRSIIRQ